MNNICMCMIMLCIYGVNMHALLMHVCCDVCTCVLVCVCLHVFM